MKICREGHWIANYFHLCIKNHETQQTNTTHTFTPIRSLSQLNSDTSSSMNTAQFEMFGSSAIIIGEVEPMLTLSLKRDLLPTE